MSATPRSEDARGFYQQRMALLYLVGLSLSVAFLAVNVVARLIVDGDPVAAFRERWFHAAATGVLGAVWLVLRRGRASYRLLEVADTAVVLLLSALFSLNAALYPIRIVSVFNMALVPGLVAVLRAVMVPSTARRTLLLGTFSAATALAFFLLSAFHPSWPVVQRGHEEWPLPLQLASFGLWIGALVATSTVASRVIYRLRSEVRAARTLGQYVLGERLGEGGMGIVHRATHALLRRETALKLLPPDRVDPDTIRRFEREVVETARLRHPNTVAIYDYGRTPDGVFYYAMEYLDGLTLGELVSREGPLPPGRVIFLLAQVLNSLDEAHSKGIIHRDIKPANVMVTGNQAAYDLVTVLDFGLVKSAAPLDGGTSLTGVGQVTGTPQYMAPEVITRADAAEPRSDLYGVAALGYYLLSGEHVFDGASAIEILAAQLHARPVPVHERVGRDVPEDLEALVMKGLAKSPGDRPQSAAEFRSALQRCDVPAWTQEDARAWWRTDGARARRGEHPRQPVYTPTVTVVPADRIAPG